jgi:hypothetical protein
MLAAHSGLPRDWADVPSQKGQGDSNIMKKFETVISAADRMDLR